MNNVNLTGSLLYKPDIKQIKLSNIKYSDFVLVVNNDRNNKRLSHCDYVFINCRAYDEDCEYIFRNCYQGTVVEIIGQLASYVIRKQGEDKSKYMNFIVVSKISAITKSQIILEDLDEFIEKYDMAKIKSQIDAKKKKEKEELDALKETIWYEEEKEDGKKEDV